MWEKIIMLFVENLYSLEYYVTSVGAVLQENMRKTFEENENVAQLLNSVLKEVEFEQIYENENEPSILEMASEEGLIEGEIIDADEYHHNDGFDGERIHVKIARNSKNELVSMKFENMTQETGDKFSRFFKSMNYMNKSNGILYEGSLISLVIYFETLITDILKEVYMKSGDGLIENHSLTFREIKELGGIEDAINYLTEKEIMGLMYKGFEEWCKYLKNKLNLDLDYLGKTQDDIIEIINRRNLYVHNRGIVNKTYLSRVSSKYNECTELGEKLIIDEKYIEDSISIIEEFGVMLVCENWIKEFRGNTEEYDSMSEVMFYFMDKEKWKLVSKMNELVLNKGSKYINQKQKMICKINYWQSMKWQDSYESIREEVEKEDTSALTKDFQLCIHALNENYELFFAILEEAFETDINEHELESWPIFKEIRKMDQYKKFRDDKGISIGNDVK